MKISSESHRTGMATLNAIQKNWTIQEDLFPHTLSIEKDPHGKEANSPGSKLDAGKNRLGLVFGGFPLALQEVGKVGTFGANKYTDNGWVSVPNGIERYTDALYRHLLKASSGEVLDKDSDLDHLAHAAWNALAVLELRLKDSK